MSAEDFLKQGQFVRLTISANEKYLKSLRERADGLTKSGGLGGTNFNTDKLAEMVAAIIDLDNLITAETHRLTLVETQIYNAISAIDNYKLRFILQEKYMNNKSFEQIADESNFDSGWVRKLHQRALQEFQNKFMGELVCLSS